MALDESFKRPGSVPFKWEVQPGIPKQHHPAPAAAGDVVVVPPAPRLALPPAARVVVGAAPCRRTSSWAAEPPPPLKAPLPSHRRSMSARFTTSLALMPFTRRGRPGGGGHAGAGAAKDDAEFCLLYADRE